MLKFETLNWNNRCEVLPSILSHSLTGVVLHDVLTTAEIEKFIQTIATLKSPFYNDLNECNGYSLPGMFGQLHKTQSVELVKKYFAEIESFCKQCNEATGFDVQAFITDKLKTAFQPYITTLLPGFLPYSFRIVLPGKGGLYLHRDGDLLHYIHEEPSEKIQQYIRPETMMSWFFTLQETETGGELWVAHSRYAHLQKHGAFQLKDTDGTIIESEASLEHITVKTPARSLLLFNGGNYWHKVIAPDTGGKERITLGGFMALSLDGKQIYYWS